MSTKLMCARLNFTPMPDTSHTIHPRLAHIPIHRTHAADVLRNLHVITTRGGLMHILSAKRRKMLLLEQQHAAQRQKEKEEQQHQGSESGMMEDILLTRSWSELSSGAKAGNENQNLERPRSSAATSATGFTPVASNQLPR